MQAVALVMVVYLTFSFTSSQHNPRCSIEEGDCHLLQGTRRMQQLVRYTLQQQG
jgi:hypothetical protein